MVNGLGILYMRRKSIKGFNIGCRIDKRSQFKSKFEKSSGIFFYFY